MLSKRNICKPFMTSYYRCLTKDEKVIIDQAIEKCSYGRFFEMSRKIISVESFFEDSIFKQIKKELQSRNKDVYIFYGPKDVNDFFIRNNEVFLPKYSKLLNKKIKPEFLKKVEKLEISCPQSFGRLLLSCERDIGFHYRSEIIYFLIQ